MVGLSMMLMKYGKPLYHAAKLAVEKAQVSFDSVVALVFLISEKRLFYGIRVSDQVIGKAIVWQDRRTEAIVNN